MACAVDPVEAVRVAALEHLPLFEDEQVIGIIGAALRHDTPRARAAAARGLARLESPDALALLSDALSDPDQWVRYHAARALGDHRNGPPLPRLAVLAESDPSVPARIAAIDAIGLRGSREAISALLRCAALADAEIAAAALRALGRLGGDEVMDPLRTNGRSEEIIRRRGAIEGLGAHGSADAVAQLEWIAAAEAEAPVAELALAALSAVASTDHAVGRAAIDALLSLCAVPELRDRAAACLSRLPAEVASHVSGGLAHTDPAVRRRTVDILARFRRPEATRHLAAAFGDTDPGVRETAVVAVMRLGSTSFDDVLGELAQRDASKAVRRAAAAALASRRSPQ
jgi:HEAT repeat protein